MYSIVGVTRKFRQVGISIDNIYTLFVFKYCEGDDTLYYNIYHDGDQGRPFIFNESITNYTEEEMFQFSLIWEGGIDVYLFQAIQKLFEDEFPMSRQGVLQWNETFVY